MRTTVALLIVALLAIPAFADENPTVRLFLSGSTTEYVSQIEVPAAPFNVYLVAECIDTGLRAVASTCLTDIPGFPAGVPTYPLSGTNVIGGFNDPAGWAIAWANCEYPDVTGFLVIASVPYYATGSGTITLSAHPTEAHKAIGCNFVADQYCILQNFGVGVPAPEVPECPLCGSPVEDSSWGSIKALYR